MRFLFPFLCLLLCQGCVIARYSRTPLPENPDAERTSFTFYGLFVNEKAMKIAIDKVTKTTSAGVTIGQLESTVDDEALKATVEGITEGVVRGLKGLP